MRILVTGSRDWSDAGMVEAALITTAKQAGVSPDEVTVVHGGARGADRLAGAIAEVLGMGVEAHPANWNLYGKRAGFIRNAEMVEAGADEVLAFWDGESRGTAHTIKLAQDAGLHVTVFFDTAARA